MTTATTVTKEQIKLILHALRTSGQSTTVQLAKYMRIDRDLVGLILKEALQRNLVRNVGKLHWAAVHSEAPKPPEVRRAHMLRYLRARIEHAIEDAAKARTKMVTELQACEQQPNPLVACNNALSAIRWADGFCRAQHLGEMAAQLILDSRWSPELHGEDKLIDRVRIQARDLTTNLVNYWYRPCSSSEFHNAAVIEKASAASSWVRDLQSWLAEYDSADKDEVE